MSPLKTCWMKIQRKGEPRCKRRIKNTCSLKTSGFFWPFFGFICTAIDLERGWPRCWLGGRRLGVRQEHMFPDDNYAPAWLTFLATGPATLQLHNKGVIQMGESGHSANDLQPNTERKWYIKSSVNHFLIEVGFQIWSWTYPVFHWNIWPGVLVSVQYCEAELFWKKTRQVIPCQLTICHLRNSFYM